MHTHDGVHFYILESFRNEQLRIYTYILETNTPHRAPEDSIFNHIKHILKTYYNYRNPIKVTTMWAQEVPTKLPSVC
jgi:hypothetical protein